MPSLRARHHIAAMAQGKGREPASAKFLREKRSPQGPGCGGQGRRGGAARPNILRDTAPASLDGPPEILLHPRASRCVPGAAAQKVRPALPRYRMGQGSVAEWFKALVLKTSVRGTVPWVRIPPLPPIT